MHPNRNDTCPCGSGRKYKKCCGQVKGLATTGHTARSTDIPATPEVLDANRVKSLDHTLVEQVMRFGRAHLGRDWIEPALDAYTGGERRTVEETELQLAIPWAMFHYPLPGRGTSLAHVFDAEKARHLPPELREMLAAQLHAWLSVWEVRQVQTGVGVLVSDLLTGEERFVHEISATQFLNARTAVLAIVVDGGVSFFGAIHPQPLKPRDADLVVREIRKMCRVRTRPVRPDRLRDPGIQLALIYMWRGIVERRHEPQPTPKLTNTDGDPLAFTTDHFEILTPDRSALLARLASFPGAQEPEEGEAGEAGTVIVITKPGNASMKSWDNTIIGRVVVAERRMRVESNSTNRANALRSSLLSHLGELARHRLRDETSQQEMFRVVEEKPREFRELEASRQAPELARVEREFRERYMVEWLDGELPALGGLTPREAAARSPKSRASLDLLLREFEYHESRREKEERFDVRRLRAALGMPG